eukprot:343279_1
MASVVDWTKEIDNLRKDLLQLDKKQLIKACKYKHVTYSVNKKETIDRLLETVDHHAQLVDRIAFYEHKDSNDTMRRHGHGKLKTQFSHNELVSVGLGWLKPPTIDVISPNVDDNEDENIENNMENISHIIRPQTTQAISYPTPFDYYQHDETNEIALKEELNKKIESYGTFEVMSSLLFGFAVSVAFENVNNIDGDKKSIYEEIAEIIFTVFITIVLICNAYTMVVMSLTYFHVYRYMADKEYIMATIYLKIYANYRKYARRSFYIGLVCFISAIGIYLLPLLNIISRFIVLIFLGSGLFIIIFTLISMTNPSRIADRNNPGHRKFLSAFIEKGGIHEKTS